MFQNVHQLVQKVHTNNNWRKEHPLSALQRLVRWKESDLLLAFSSRHLILAASQVRSNFIYFFSKGFFGFGRLFRSTLCCFYLIRSHSLLLPRLRLQRKLQLLLLQLGKSNQAQSNLLLLSLPRLSFYLFSVILRLSKSSFLSQRNQRRSRS